MTGRRRPKIGPNNRETRRAAQLVDDVAEFTQYRAEVLRKIRQDIRQGMSAKEIRKKYAAILQGRMITDALTTEDPDTASRIAKDVIDRVEGKATEKKEVTHKFSELTDQELDSVLESEDAELKEMEAKFEQ